METKQNNKNIRIKHLKSILAWATIFSITSIIASCNSAIFYDEHKTIVDNVWNIDNKLVFNVDVDEEDLSNAYNFFIDLRNTKNYPYSNAFLFIKTIFPDGRFALDTMECPLTEPSGKWYGRVSNNHIDNRFYLRKSTIFPQKGIYQFEIFHGMRDTNIIGIKNIGLRIEKVQ